MYSSVDKRDVASSFPFSSEAERKKFLFHNQSHKIDSVPQFFTHSFAVDFRDQLGKVSFEVHFGIIAVSGSFAVLYISPQIFQEPGREYPRK